MAGTFSKATRPLRDGAYFNWITVAAADVQPSVGRIVAIPFTSDWGPFKTPTLVQSFGEYLSVFGPTVGTPGYKAAWQAFMGEGGLEGRYGAGAVLCYRTGTGSAAKATKVLQNTTPANAITLTARYEGTFGNSMKVTTQDHASDGTKNELLIYVGASLVETYVYTDTNIADLVAQINANSDWITATQTVTGTALTAVSSQSFASGTDGSTLTGTEWTALMADLSSQRFGVFVPYALTDPTILASIKSWAGGVESGSSGLNTKGKRFEVVVGGVGGESNSDAVTRAATFNDGNFITLGQNSFVDSLLLDANGNPTTLNSAEFAARFAGGLAQRGESMGTSFMRFPGIDLLAGTAPSESEILSALQGGVVVFSKDSDPDAPVRVEKGITTYTNQAQAAFPYKIYRNPKFMATMHGVEVEFTDWATSIIGKLPVNSKTRDEAIAEVTTRLKARASVAVIQDEFSVAVDDDPPPSDDDEFIALKIGIKFGRSVEQVYFTATAS